MYGGELMDYIYNDDLSFSKYLSKCFMWMFIGLLISFGTGAIFNYTGLFVTLFSSFGTMFTLVLAIVEIILVISVSRSVFKLNLKKAIKITDYYLVESILVKRNNKVIRMTKIIGYL